MAACDEIDLAKLADEPFILEDRAYDYDITRVITNAGVHPDVRWTSKDELAILAMVKLELGVCKGKQLHDKRDDMAKRDAQRESQRAFRDAQKR